MTVTLTLGMKLNQIEKGQTLTIFEDKILATTKSQNFGTMVFLAGGVSLPVQETEEQIINKVSEVRNNARK